MAVPPLASSLPAYVGDNADSIAQLAVGHVWVVALSMAIATLAGVLLGLVAYRSSAAASVVITVASVILTLPSFALLGVLLALLGLGVVPVVIALVLYALLPIVRNTITGLRSVDPVVLDGARGIGMAPLQRLVRVELPIAWPVILAGIRTATQLVVGITAIAAYVNGPGLGRFIYSGLSQLGGANATNQILVGTFGVVVIALVFDALLALVGRATVSKGIRA
ncbi:ABC transporter permease [Patulibacter brassicae]|uniref:ABC transporter permease n=1 Tax=Patulibacter brassicae TaxID=1705717 RepID=A0ABU4VFP8_9ACTN|nr:ABC transporter permease [Patulibacter brassicae]MDX8150640.1 ABC transporter permease [Patulibacter brassicae]